MESPADRLKRARKDSGFETATEAARAMGIPPPTYLGHENGTTGFRRDAAIQYARKFRVSLDWLLTGKGTLKPAEVPVVAFIGAGAQIYPMDDHAKGAGLEMVPAPPGITDCVAAIIRGDSMHPLKDGWLVFWSREYDGVPEDCVGALCVVQISDGPCLIKELQRGSKRGYYTLTSWNAPIRENVRLEWAAKVLDIRPK